MTADLLSIGHVARLAGLTTKALRHYDRVGVLRPAEVGENGYRRYSREQVETARRIRVLRELEVPLDEIRRVLADDAEGASARIVSHRRRIRARLTQLQTIHYQLGRVAEGEELENLMPARPTAISLELDVQKKLARDLFNFVWTLMEREDRTDRETERMIDAAHASRFFWEEIGGPVNHARGEWQISRAYAIADRAEPALHHAQRCLRICEEHGIGDFDLAYAYEALARAHVVAGEPDTADKYEALAREGAERIAEDDDRELVLGDLATLR